MIGFCSVDDVVVELYAASDAGHASHELRPKVPKAWRDTEYGVGKAWQRVRWNSAAAQSAVQRSVAVWLKTSGLARLPAVAVNRDTSQRR